MVLEWVQICKSIGPVIRYDFLVTIPSNKLKRHSEPSAFIRQVRLDVPKTILPPKSWFSVSISAQFLRSELVNSIFPDGFYNPWYKQKHTAPQKLVFNRDVLLELPAGARPGGRPEWVRDRRATAFVFGELTWDLSWTHPCGSPQSNSSHLLRIVTCHVFFQWQTSSWAVLICGMSPNTLDRQPFHFSRCQVIGR